jgi:hypothetical protein
LHHSRHGAASKDCIKQEGDMKMDKPWGIEGKWSISHFGWNDEVRKTMPLLPKKVGLRDVTFREGGMCVEAGSTNIRIVPMYLNERTILDQLKVFPKMKEVNT